MAVLLAMAMLDASSIGRLGRGDHRDHTPLQRSIEWYLELWAVP